MNKLSRTAALALSLAAAACSSGGGGGGGGGGSATAIDCSWFTGANCYKDVANAAKACTNAALTGRFNADTSLCTYTDGTTVQFDPAHTATMAFESFGPWDFTVVTSTATTCARYVDTGEWSWTLTAGGRTFSADLNQDPAILTCPDGSSYSIAGDLAMACLDDFPGWISSRSGALRWFSLRTAPTTTMLWRCQ